ncbi:MAG: DUF6515 family protein, partial [Bacteroidota bacterium]
VLLLMPSEMAAQRRTVKRGDSDTYQRTANRNRNTAASYGTRTRSTVTKRPANVAKREYTTRTRQSIHTRATHNKTATRRDYNTSVNRTAKNRANDPFFSNRTRTNTATNGRLVNRNERNTRSNFRYTANEVNDYCRNYYTGLNTWNRLFWNSIHYTPTYYDLTYRNFPFNNGLRAERFRFMGNRYWLYDGVWFRKRFGRYYAVDAPIGVCIDALPLGGEMVWFRGDRYVIYRGTAYKMLPFGGFQVVPMLRRF